MTHTRAGSTEESMEASVLQMSFIVAAAKRAVKSASVLSTAVQGSILTGQMVSKADASASPVTIADFGAQAVIAMSLRSSLPAGLPVRMVGEEDDKTLLACGDALIQDVVSAVNGAYTREASSGAAPVPWGREDVVAAVALGGFDGVASPDAPLGSAARSAWDEGYWVLDPIDGTRGFLRGAQYAVGLAYIRCGLVQVAVMGCPNLPFPRWDGRGDFKAAAGVLGSLFTAVRGKGTYSEPLVPAFTSPSAADEAVAGGASGGGDDDALVAALTSHGAAVKVGVDQLLSPAGAVYGESVESKHGQWDLTARVGGRLGITAPPVRLDSMIKYGMLARGDLHLYFRFPPSGHPIEYVWDHAPGSLVLEEAGGKVTDIMGKPLDFSQGRSLAGNVGVIASCGGVVHDAAIAVAHEEWTGSSSTT